MKKCLPAAGLVIIGDEILSGRRADKHFDYGIDYFSQRGVEIAWTYYLQDSLPSLVSHFKMIKRSGDICFSFGGIGATPDDLTRQAMAEAHGVKLVRHPEAVALLENKFGADTYPNRIKMAELPEGACLIPNDYNNIPGFFVGTIHCLPGFPEMARPMMDWVVTNNYSLPKGDRGAFESLLVCDVYESQLVPLLEAVQKQFPDIKLSSLPHMMVDGQRQIELGVRGEKGRAEEVMQVVKNELVQMGMSKFRQS